ncbi:Imm1 family immunity protein [[Limnothrix rosea] IAM M-220]|uniref:Imm1 family immunity protein n=1 Tax=[Limnothrix rosea] IAM M-220 TaxID=454133 RepID=UPI0009663C1A|nr:Imm1 family immunity protein [[Limnothrix rosea] IAM M-220]OKH19810.1 hypothetical protein NIES208_01420 [[Limnothrix rosea] IAM M-220]
MFISYFSFENWQGNRNDLVTKAVENWSDIETEIRRLNAKTQTLVTLETEDEVHMAIGGGQGQYVAYVALADESFHNIIDPSKSEREVNVMVGGQESPYPEKQCVALETVLQAAKTFAESGQMDKTVVWEEDLALELV